MTRGTVVTREPDPRESAPEPEPRPAPPFLEVRDLKTYFSLRGSFPRVPAKGRSNMVSLNQLLGL